MNSLVIITLFCILFPLTSSFAEKLYVVEREREGLSVIEDFKRTKMINGLGNMNHATVKVHGGFAYVISRDGFLSKLDIQTDSLVRKVKVGKSSISFTSVDDVDLQQLSDLITEAKRLMT